MSSDAPTGFAVADAVLHYRRIRELTRDELSYVLGMLDHELTDEDID
ncbi:hypothetical protein [Brachybacterium sp. GCM10030252]